MSTVRKDVPENITPKLRLIFRLTHRDNLRWLLEHGLHCARSTVLDPGFVSIGKADLIGRRLEHPLMPPFAGYLGDYVPFYFTPFTPMFHNICTGWGGVQRRTADELVFIISSISRLGALRIPFVFSDRHAYLATARFSNRQADLERWVPWQKIRARDFHHDADRPDEFDAYQAEALIPERVPVEALLGMVALTTPTYDLAACVVADKRLKLPIRHRPHWYRP